MTVLITPEQPVSLRPSRLDRALATDVRLALRSRPILAFLALELVAGIAFVARRGSATTQTILLVWLGLGLLAFICWWAGRHRAARPTPDAMPRAPERLVAALLIVSGFAVWTYGVSEGIGGLMVLAGIVAWFVVAVRARIDHGARSPSDP